jgi:hypothetical protein
MQRFMRQKRHLGHISTHFWHGSRPVVIGPHTKCMTSMTSMTSTAQVRGAGPLSTLEPHTKKILFLFCLIFIFIFSKFQSDCRYICAHPGESKNALRVVGNAWGAELRSITSRVITTRSSCITVRYGYPGVSSATRVPALSKPSLFLTFALFVASSSKDWVPVRRRRHTVGNVMYVSWRIS